MSGTDDLFKSLQMMNEGATQMTMGLAARDAQAQLNQINSAVGNEQERLAQQNAVGQQLAMRLQAAGAPADQIMATAGRLSVSGGEQAQMQNALQQQKSSQDFEIGKKLPFERQTALMELDKKLEIQRAGIQRKTAQVANTFADKFGKDHKDEIGQLQQFDTMISNLQKNPKSPVVSNLAQMEFVRAAMKRANITEIQMANPTQDTKGKLYRELGIRFSNQDLSGNAAFWTKLAEAEKSHIANRLNESAKGAAMSEADGSPDVDPSQLLRKVQGKHLAPYGFNPYTPQQSSPQTPGVGGGAQPPGAAPQAPAPPPGNKYLMDN